MTAGEGSIPKHGGYRNLKSCQIDIDWRNSTLLSQFFDSGRGIF